MRFFKYFVFYFLVCFILGQICYLVVSFFGWAFTYIKLPLITYGTYAFQPYGSLYRMPSYHWDHPILYWTIMSLSFGCVSALWKTYTIQLSSTRKNILALLVIPLSIQSASVPATLLWAFHDMQAGRYHGFAGSIEYMLSWIPSGFTLALPLYLLSFPFNLLVSVCAIYILFSKKINVILERFVKAGADNV